MPISKQEQTRDRDDQKFVVAYSASLSSKYIQLHCHLYHTDEIVQLAQAVTVQGHEFVVFRS